MLSRKCRSAEVALETNFRGEKSEERCEILGNAPSPRSMQRNGAAINSPQTQPHRPWICQLLWPGNSTAWKGGAAAPRHRASARRSPNSAPKVAIPRPLTAENVGLLRQRRIRSQPSQSCMVVLPGRITERPSGFTPDKFHLSAANSTRPVIAWIAQHSCDTQEVGKICERA